MRSKLLGLLLLPGLALAASITVPARAQTAHEALVVIDTGSSVKHVCVRFAADSISGKDALDLADQVDPSVQPVYRDYGGDYGVAVCSLCGVGSPVASCPGNPYWAYYRAPSGATQFTYSQVGASNTRVHDGDVEGWHWGASPAPPYASVRQVCGTVTTNGTFMPDPAAPGSPGAPASVAPSVAPGAPSRAALRPRASSPQPTTSLSPGLTTTSAADATPSAAVDTSSTSAPNDGRREAAQRQTSHRSPAGGSLGGLAAFGAAMGVLLGSSWWVRRHRA
jgi:hypothetical protein